MKVSQVEKLEKEIFPVLDYSPLTTVVRAGLVQSGEPVAFSRSPTWV